MHHSLEQLLDSSDATARLMDHARLLLRLSKQYEKIVPAGLQNHSRVTNYKAGKIVIHADNGAVAAKLRQMSASLCRQLLLEGTEFSGLDIKVQPREIPYQSTVSTKKPLSAKAGAALREAATAMPADSPLRAALQQLLDRAEVMDQPPP